MNVVLLCGGKGLRLRPLTDKIPKPLAKLNGKPILHYVLNHLKEFNIKKVIYCVGYKSDKIVKYLSKKSYPWETAISDAGDVDIIQRIRKALKNNSEINDFLILYGDTISDVNINKLKAYHVSHDRPVTISTWPFKLQFGIVNLDAKSHVISFKEKPNQEIWINIGYIYVSKQIIENFKNFKSFENFLVKMSIENKISAFKHYGEHVTINSLKELKEAEMYLAKRDK